MLFFSMSEWCMESALPISHFRMKGLQYDLIYDCFASILYVQVIIITSAESASFPDGPKLLPSFFVLSPPWLVQAVQSLGRLPQVAMKST